MSASPRRRLLAAIPVEAVIAALLVVAAPTAATAHDQVVSTAPASQEQLPVAPDQVSMLFTADILDIGATILVVDDDGENWAFGDMQVEGREAIQIVEEGMPDANYQVRWRVVSSDGHPISGTFDFAVGDAPASAAVPAEQSPATPTPTLAEPDAAVAKLDDPVAPPFLLIGIGGGVVGIAVFVLAIVLTKPRPRRS